MPASGRLTAPCHLVDPLRSLTWWCVSLAVREKTVMRCGSGIDRNKRKSIRSIETTLICAEMVMSCIYNVPVGRAVS